MSLHRNIGYVQPSEMDILLIDPSLEENMQAATTTGGVETYVTGDIKDSKTGDPLPAYIQLIWNTTGLKLTDPFLVDNGNYSAWTDQSPFEVSVVFTAQGYKGKTIQISTLVNNPDVTLEKVGTAPYTYLLLGAGLLAISKQKPTRTKRKMGAIGLNTETLVVVAGGLIFIKTFGMFNDLLKFLGLSKGEGTKAVETEIADPTSAFKPTYWQQYNSFPNGAFTETEATAFCKTIHSAFGIVSDDYNATYSVFAQMRSKANVSFVAWEFSKQYNEDLLTFLTNGGGILPWDGLNESHLASIITLVRNLPTN